MEPKSQEIESMKKSLIAAAVLSTVTGAAFAQASSVTLYGAADVGLGVGTAAGSKFQMNPGGQDIGGFRIGMRGAENLGGGLTAKFDLQSDAHSGETGASGNIGGRAAWIGLAGGFGEIHLGRHYRLSVPATGLISNFGWRGTSSQGNGLGLRSTIDTNGGIGVSSRYNSAISYLLPAGLPVSGGVQFVLKPDFGAASVLDVGLNYAAGPLGLGFGFAKATGGSANMTLGASFNAGFATIRGGFINNAKVAKGFTLGATVPLGAVTAGIELTRRTTAPKATGLEIGGLYALSNRTNIGLFANKTTGLKTGFVASVGHSF
jgi:predicted porin